MKKNLKSLLYCCLFFSHHFTYSQDLTALVLDSLNKHPIPFASIYLKSGSGVISNEEGQFRLQYKQNVSDDSLFISCLGYKTLKYSVEQLQDSIFYLPPKAITLNSVILTNKELNADEILKAIQKNISEKYELGLTQKKIFLRESGTEEFKKLNVKIKKTTIDEFNQRFWDSTLSKFPRKNKWFEEAAGLLLGDYSEKNQKLELYKALELEDKKTAAIFENTEALFDTILKENIKTTSYFKVRSGLIGGKVESSVFETDPSDSLPEVEKAWSRKKDYLTQKKRQITNLIKTLFKEGSLNLTVLNKASRYNFKVVDMTFFGTIPVYVLDFNPKGNADYKGRLFIDADHLTLMRLEYKNIQNIRDFNLLGVSFKQDLKEVVLQFKKTINGKYGLEYFEYSTAFEGGFDRPLVITEKNKIVKGRKKQNQLKMDLDVVTKQYQKIQLVVFETLPINQAYFNDFKETPKVLPENLTQYDPSFWKGYSIIEPNKAIRSYKLKKN